MGGFHVAVVPVGRVSGADLEPVLAKVAKVWRGPIELRAAVPVPHASEDPARRQHRAAKLLELLRKEVLKLAPGKLVGAAEATVKPGLRPQAYVFVTDQDLYTAKTDGVIAAVNRAAACAVVSVRRVREAFYKRRADPVRQSARLVKEILRVTGRLAGAGECPDPRCVLAPTRGVPDIDVKQERYCRACEQRLFEGKLRL